MYGPGQPVQVTVTLHCRPVRRIKKLAVTLTQAVDVAMFSSGYFKVSPARTFFSFYREKSNSKIEQKIYERNFKCPQYNLITDEYQESGEDKS